MPCNHHVYKFETLNLIRKHFRKVTNEYDNNSIHICLRRFCNVQKIIKLDLIIRMFKNVLRIVRKISST